MDTKEPEQCHYLTKLLNIHLIFREVAKYLALQDLISCSGVNRGWCVLFRKYIWEFRTCSIRLVWLDRPCQQLRDLNKLLASSIFAPLPYNGIIASDRQNSGHFSYDDYSCPAEPHENVDLDCYDTILRKVRLTSCELFFPERDWRKGVEEHPCPAILCMKKIISLNAPELRTLSLRQTPEVISILEYFEVDVSLRPGWLGKLETLNFGSQYGPRSIVHREEILESSPNLKAIIGWIPRWMIDRGSRGDVFYNGPLNGIVPVKKYRCIKEADGLTASQLLRVAKEKPELNYLSLYNPSFGLEGYTFELFGSNDYTNLDMAVTAIKILFRSSFTSLRRIRGDIFQLGVLGRELDQGSWPMPTVAGLELFSTYEELSYFKYMNLPRMFPKLSQVSIWVKKRTYDLDPNLLRYESDFDYADSPVQNLDLYGYIPAEYLKTMELTFPNLTGFTYHQCEEVKEMCEALWEMNWGKMRRVHFCSVPVNLDVDDAFFGLPPAEREFFESQEGMDPHFYHVSSKYSVFNFQSLMTIHLELEECKSRDCSYIAPRTLPNPFPSNEIRSSPIVSRIAVQKISRACPGLEMEILIEPGFVPSNAPLIFQDTCTNSALKFQGSSTLLKHPGLHSTTCRCPHRYRRDPRKDVYNVKWKFNASFK